MVKISLDNETDLVDEHFAVVYAPRRSRDRFPENCVEIVETQAAARAGADPRRSRVAARVLGPSRSSEGLRLYYLVCWLD